MTLQIFYLNFYNSYHTLEIFKVAAYQVENLAGELVNTDY